MNYSICISTIYKSISKFDIHEFMEKNLGKVSRIDCVDLNQNNRRVFVHFSEWYSNKEFPAIVLHQLESEGFCNFYIPNKKNKKNPHFYVKILINKNPISHADYKITIMNRVIGNWCGLTRELQDKINVLESKVLLLEDEVINNDKCISKLYGYHYGIDMDDVMGHMNINELDC